MKKSYFGYLMLFSAILFFIIGCSNESEKPSSMSKENSIPTSVQKYTNKNQIVIMNTSSNLEEILTGSRKAFNLSKLFTFLDDVKAQKDATLQFTIVDKNGEHATNELRFKNKEYVYTNTYKGYDLPVGTFHCTDLNDNGSTQLNIDGCKESDAISNMPTVMFTAADYQAAKKEYRNSKQ